MQQGNKTALWRDQKKPRKDSVCLSSFSKGCYSLPRRAILRPLYSWAALRLGDDSWTVKMIECRRTDAFEVWCWSRLESSLDSKEIKPVNPKGNQSWIFIGRTEAEAPTFWPPDVKRWLIGKDPDSGKNWGQEEKETTEDEMAGWHHRPDGHGFGWTLGVGDGQEGLACCSSWGYKESDMTEQLNWTEWLNCWLCHLFLLPNALPSKDSEIHALKLPGKPIMHFLVFSFTLI